MPVHDDQLSMVPDAAAALGAYRREQAEAAMWNMLLRERELDAANRAAAALPHRPGDTAPFVQSRTRDAGPAGDKARGLLRLAGLADEALPWHVWLTEARERLATAEATWIQMVDQLEHGEVYGVDPAAAELSAAQARADVDSWRAAITEWEPKAEAARAAAVARVSGEPAAPT